jgi:hypothetical protein
MAEELRSKVRDDKNFSPFVVGRAVDDFLCDVSNPDNRTAAV